MHITTDNFEEAVELIRQQCSRHCNTDIAEATGLGKATVSDFAYNRTRCPRLENFVRLAGYFGHTVTMMTMVELAKKGRAA